MIARKKLPPLGAVVVYGRGLGGAQAEEAARLLNEKPGIQAEVLEGGYAAWETDRGATTAKTGFQLERLDYITYQDLSEIGTGDEVVLVDLRKQPKSDPGRLTRQGVAEETPTPALTELTEKFPGRTVVQSPFEVAAVASRTSGRGKRQAMSSEPERIPVLVLIDSGDGEAEKTARILRMNGIRRVVILAGGEHILERDGAPGLKRMGMGMQTLEGEDE